MFTPQNKGWSRSPSIRDADANPRGSVAGAASHKGKGKIVVESPPPPQASLGENGVDFIGGDGEVEAWRRFREAGFLDESVLQRKDREALVQRIGELEKELHGYQYNMGLLLIEKKDSIAKYEEVRQALAEAEEMLQREQAAHLILISEHEKSEEKLHKDLGIEKQKVAVLEKDLREVRSQIAEVKFTSEKKLADAQALESGLEEKYLEIEAKAHAADAKLAEASRKNSEINRKLNDLEARERKLLRESLSLASERKVHEKDLSEQREHLLDWEKRLQDSQKGLVESQRLLNEREDRANEVDLTLKRKQADLEETKKAIEASKKSLKLEEDDIHARISSLASKEKEVNIKFEGLEKKERELFTREEKINAREKVEIQKLLDDHNSMLDSKKREFELELETRKKAFDEEMRIKVVEVDEKKKEIDRKEEKIAEREHLLEINLSKVKEMEKDLDSKSQVLKKWEESVSIDEKKLEKEKQQLENDRQELLKSISELEIFKASIEVRKEQIIKEEEHLKLTKQEREEHNLLMSKLKHEIEDCRIMKDSLNRDRENLKQEREKFEEEWELLDEKRLTLELELKKVDEERQRFEKWRFDEEERIKNESQAEKLIMEERLEDLRKKEEVLEKTMEEARLDVHEMLKRGQIDMARELELRKHELEMEMQKRKEVMEKDFQEKKSEFERKKATDLDEIQSLRSSTESKTKKLEMELGRLEMEREDLRARRNKLENEQHEIQKDIDILRVLSKEMKDQREKFIKEKEQFLALIEQCKICKNCGVTVHDLELLRLQDAGVVQLPRLTFEDKLKVQDSEASPGNNVSPSVTPGGRLSWLQKCSRLFNFSPTKKNEDAEQLHGNNPVSLDLGLDRETPDDKASDELTLSQGITTKYFDSQRGQSGNGVKDNEEYERVGLAGEEPEPSYGVADNSADMILIQKDNTDKEVVFEQVTFSNNQHEGSNVPPGNDSQPEQTKEKTSQPIPSGKPKRIRRTRTVKAVVEEAKHIIGETCNEKNVQPNGQGKHSSDFQEENEGDILHAGQKRGLSHVSVTSEQDMDSETRSESISLGGRRKKRQVTAPRIHPPGEKRYNFRRTTIAAAAIAAKSASDQTKGVKIGYQRPTGDETLKGTEGDGEGTSKLRLEVEPASSFVAESEKPIDKNASDADNVMVAHEISAQHDSEFHDHDPAKSVEFSGQSGEDGVAVDGERALETELATPDGSGAWSEGNESEGDEDESDHHNVSIGKKLWTFFTT